MSAEVESAIEDMLHLMRQHHSGIRWVRRANLHLTLRFLGNAVARNILQMLDKILQDIALQSSPFTLQALGTGAFPNLDRPRTIWIGLACEQLIRLARLVEDAAIGAGLAPESRAYTPHLTIGRVRDLRGWQRIRRPLSQLSNRDFGTTLISEMILYRSILGGEAPQYEVLARYPFGAAS